MWHSATGNVALVTLPHPTIRELLGEHRAAARPAAEPAHRGRHLLRQRAAPHKEAHKEAMTTHQHRRPMRSRWVVDVAGVRHRAVVAVHPDTGRQMTVYTPLEPGNRRVLLNGAGALTAAAARQLVSPVCQVRRLR